MNNNEINKESKMSNTTNTTPEATVPDTTIPVAPQPNRVPADFVESLWGAIKVAMTEVAAEALKPALSTAADLSTEALLAEVERRTILDEAPPQWWLAKAMALYCTPTDLPGCVALHHAADRRSEIVAALREVFGDLVTIGDPEELENVIEREGVDTVVGACLEVSASEVCDAIDIGEFVSYHGSDAIEACIADDEDAVREALGWDGALEKETQDGIADAFEGMDAHYLSEKVEATKLHEALGYHL